MCYIIIYVKSRITIHTSGSFDSEEETARIMPGNWRLNGVEEDMRSVDIMGSDNYLRSCKESRDCFYLLIFQHYRKQPRSQGILPF